MREKDFGFKDMRPSAIDGSGYAVEGEGFVIEGAGYCFEGWDG